MISVIFIMRSCRITHAGKLSRCGTRRAHRAEQAQNLPPDGESAGKREGRATLRCYRKNRELAVQEALRPKMYSTEMKRVSLMGEESAGKKKDR